MRDQGRPPLAATAAQTIRSAVRARHLALGLWLLATVLYGTLAGVLLHEHPRVAAAAMVSVWLVAAAVLVAVRRGRASGI